MSRIAPSSGDLRQRRPRQVYTRHLHFIRQLPCVITGLRPVEAAHIRAACRLYGKRAVGVGEKPDDAWTVPLSPDMHRDQHARGDELAWWRERGVDPFPLALALFRTSLIEDLDAAKQVIAEHILAAHLQRRG